ncbi:MAG TPA: hypothetical protein VLB68_11880 [Pyrinomonadaceae bacterium]|nr:hypothetical protein [Pyrinomonadaceae bacterium]
MSGRRIWPSRRKPIAKINYALMTGFNDEGQPNYAQGEVVSAKEREEVQSILEPLVPVPRTITSVAMGEVMIELEDGHRIILRPVFHPSLNAYRDLFFVDEWQYPMPSSFAALLERWRKGSRS